MDRLREQDHEKIRRFDRLAEPPARIEAGVVVVTHDAVATETIRPTFEALAAQTSSAFEVAVVDNSPERDLRPLLERTGGVNYLVSLDRNYGVNWARNLGSRVVDGEIVIFLDHDAIPREDFVEAHRRAHEPLDVAGIRGRVRPRTQTVYNALADNYDLGDERFPYVLDIEGNCSIERSAYEAVGGFDEDVWGHEGLRLTEKLVERFGVESVVYEPDAVIYHDFATSLFALVKKKARHERARDGIDASQSAAFDLYSRYRVPSTSRDRSFRETVARHVAHRVTNAAGRALYPWLFSENHETH